MIELSLKGRFVGQGAPTFIIVELLLLRRKA